MSALNLNQDLNAWKVFTNKGEDASAPAKEVDSGDMPF